MVKINATSIGGNDFTWSIGIQIGIFAIALIISNNYPIAFGIAILFMCIFLFVEDYLKNEKTRNKLKKFSLYLLYPVLWVFYALDVYSTYLSVHKYKFAQESNNYLIHLWATYGYSLGEFFHFIQAFIIFSLGLFLSTRKDRFVSLIGLFLLIMLIILYIPIILNNYDLLYNYGCGIT